MSRLALLGGKKAVKSKPEDMFKWPIVNKAMENVVLGVLREGKMSGIDWTKSLCSKPGPSSAPSALWI